MENNLIPPKDKGFLKKRSLNLRGRLITLDKPLVMGILNLSPDSFYVAEGGKAIQSDASLTAYVAGMLRHADIIDIGAVSTRPGSTGVDAGLERERIAHCLKLLVREFPDAIFSVDTWRSEVARMAVDEGCAMINDISAGTMDPGMLPAIRNLQVPYVMMHMQGTPATMQQNPHYEDVVKEISLFFAERLSLLRSLGINDIILDPGFGFGKTLEHNYEIMSRLQEFCLFDLPLLVGVSRKSMIQKALNIEAAEAMNGTTVLNTIALMKGADILRVHDTREARQAVELYSRLQ